MDLDELRGQINEVDDRLLELYERRMDLVRDVALYKMENHLPVFHPEREEQVIRRMTGRAGAERSAGARMLFTTLMDVSKSYQHRLLAEHSEKNRLYRVLEEALGHSHAIPTEATVACCGVEGAYAHEAAGLMFAAPDLRFYKRFEDVFEAVADGEQEFGVVPIENSIAGSVGAVYNLLRHYRLHIVKSCKLPVSHCLLTCGDIPIRTITDVYSHEQALDQCSHFFQTHPAVKPHVFSNTAAAAQYVAGLGSPAAAAIASHACAGLYGLRVARENLQNARVNFTRFIVISRELIIPPDADKLSLSLTLPHVTGSLYRIITRFAMHSLNLTKLESRPLPDTDFEFQFYFDMNGSVRDPDTLQLLCSLSEELAQFEFLGNYT